MGIDRASMWRCCIRYAEMPDIFLQHFGSYLVEKDGKKLSSKNAVKVGDEVTINLADGKVDAKITKIN